MLNRYIPIVAASVVLGMLGATAARADALDDIKKKGVLVVGTNADYPPIGFLDPTGKIFGFEPDLSPHVAKPLGVKHELIPLVASHRMQ
jgi:polar amino acid transport system substrate-binding protein